LTAKKRAKRRVAGKRLPEVSELPTSAAFTYEASLPLIPAFPELELTINKGEMTTQIHKSGL
jgi:hypothetical protein